MHKYASNMYLPQSLYIFRPLLRFAKEMNEMLKLIENFTIYEVSIRHTSDLGQVQF